VQTYRRRLPHQHSEGQALFLTWHLHGSLPHARYPPPGKLTAGEAFVWMDRYLDTTRVGPLFLKQPAVAKIVADTIRYAASTLNFYDLDAFVVMANHVHMLVTPKVEPPRFMKSIKNYSARKANLELGRTGQTFWQSESYDHWVRDGRELERIRLYIENNPVKAGLVKRPEQFRWSSAYKPE